MGQVCAVICGIEELFGVALTKRDAGILLPHIVALFIREEHICRESTLGCVGIWTG